MSENDLVLRIWSNMWFIIPISTGLVGGAVFGLLRYQNTRVKLSVAVSLAVTVVLYVLYPYEGTALNYSLSPLYRTIGYEEARHVQEGKFDIHQLKYYENSRMLRLVLTIFLFLIACAFVEKLLSIQKGRKAALSQPDGRKETQ